ncbi:MAG: hypothetical protein AB8B69_09455 [Chitinophagales bacterium]
MSDKVERYRYYRKATDSLMEKINVYLEDEIIRRVARTMGLENSKGQVIMDEIGLIIAVASAAMDYRVKGKTAIEKYYDERGAENDEEELLLNGLLNTYDSLFRVEEIDKPNSSMVLYDLMNKNEIILTDIGMTKSMASFSHEMLLFCKVLQIGDLWMTGGYSLPFVSGFEKLYASKYYSIVKKIKTKNPKIKRAAAFYQLYKKYGIDSKLGYVT